MVMRKEVSMIFALQLFFVQPKIKSRFLNLEFDILYVFFYSGGICVNITIFFKKKYE